jgi:hypothetical protein
MTPLWPTLQNQIASAVLLTPDSAYANFVHGTSGVNDTAIAALTVSLTPLMPL